MRGKQWNRKNIVHIIRQKCLKEERNTIKKEKKKKKRQKAIPLPGDVPDLQGHKEDRGIRPDPSTNGVKPQVTPINYRRDECKQCRNGTKKVRSLQTIYQVSTNIYLFILRRTRIASAGRVTGVRSRGAGGSLPPAQDADVANALGVARLDRGY